MVFSLSVYTGRNSDRRFSVVLSRSANADPTTAPGETVTEVFGEGRTGLASPDPKTGTMSYTYPFVVPSARGGRTCKQALYRTWLVNAAKVTLSVKGRVRAWSLESNCLLL
jgi:hypothetical protein